MAKEVVYLKWYDGDLVIKAAHSDVESALNPAAAEAKVYLGVFDGPDASAKKLAEVKQHG